jgi:hypothetical protein
MDGRTLDTGDPSHYGRAAHIALLSPFSICRSSGCAPSLILGTFVFFARWFRAQSLKMDKETGESLLRDHRKHYLRAWASWCCSRCSAAVLAWDWIMSIDAHWFSALFGWYVFAGMWIERHDHRGVLVLYLKRKGYLPQVNGSHIQDMGKWVFAVSFLWSYLYFSQFMLTWYATSPRRHLLQDAHRPSSLAHLGPCSSSTSRCPW